MNKFKTMRYENLKNKVSVLLFFIHILQQEEIEIDKFLHIYEIFIRKIKKKKIDKNQIKKKMYNPLNQTYRSTMSPLKYINWIFSQ